MGDYKTVSILVLPTDEEAEALVDELFTEARAKGHVSRRELKRAEDAAILDAVYTPKDRTKKRP
jgi:hypothetical protein